MVGREDLPNAIALNSSVVNGGRLIGPAAAGVLVAAFGEGWCFVLNGASYLAVIAALLAMRVPPAPRVPARRSALADMREGAAFVTSTGPIRALLLLLGLVSLVGMPYSVLMPLFADRILGGGAATLGLLMAANGCGALGAAGLLATRRGVRGLGRWVVASAAGFGSGLVLFALSRSLAASMLILLLVGFCMMLQMASSNTLLQTLSPDALRGRVMSAYSMMFMGMAPFGALLAGALAHRIGAPATVATGGVLSVAGAAAFAVRLPGMRAQAREMIAAQEATAGEPVEELTAPRLS
jgi:MFS family permease